MTMSIQNCQPESRVTILSCRVHIRQTAQTALFSSASLDLGVLQTLHPVLLIASSKQPDMHRVNVILGILR